MKALISVSIALSIISSCRGQSLIDSLKTRLAIEKDSLDWEDVSSCQSLIGNEFLAANQYDSALKYYHDALSIGKGQLLVAATLNSAGIAYNFKGNPDSCISYYQRARDIYRTIQDTTRWAALETNLSIIYKNIGLYDLALENAFEALKKVENKEDRTLASVYNNIASVYLRIGENGKALEFFRRSLQIRSKIGYTRGVGQSYTNIGEVFLRSRKYDSALANLFKAAEIKMAEGNRNDLGSTYNHIGHAYLEMQYYQNAEWYLLEASEIKRLSGEKTLEGSILNSLGRLRIKQNRFQEAEGYLNKAHVLLAEAGGLDELKTNLELGVILSKNTGEMTRAVKYFEELLVVRDSLLNKEKAQSLQAMQIRYDTEKKDQQIQVLQSDQQARSAELRAKQVWIGALAIVLGLASISTIVIVLQYRAVSRSKRLTELLLRELHHRVKNNLQILSTLFHLPYQNITDKVALEAVKDGEGRVNAMALIHRMLSHANLSRTIPAHTYLSQLTDFLAKSYGFENKNGTMLVQCNDIQLDIDKAVPVGLIVNELVSNSMKYAFADHAEPAVRVVLEATSGSLRLHVSDNGAGFTKSVDLTLTTSFGLRMVNLLAKELNSKLTITSNSGVNFELIIPNS